MINGVIADDAERINMVSNGKTIVKYSINELKEMKYQMMFDSLKVYTIPPLE